jgi:hypothetical protein
MPQLRSVSRHNYWRKTRKKDSAIERNGKQFREYFPERNLENIFLKEECGN